jgi:hypothetical protein
MSARKVPNKKQGRLTPVSPAAVRFEDAFWTPRLERNRTLTLDASYAHLKKNGNLAAYQWDWWDAAKGNPPWKIWVGDLPKWLEASAYSLAAFVEQPGRRGDASLGSTSRDDLLKTSPNYYLTNKA